MAKKLIDDEHTIALLHFDDPADLARDEAINGSSSWKIGKSRTRKTSEYVKIIKGGRWDKCIHFLPNDGYQGLDYIDSHGKLNNLYTQFTVDFWMYTCQYSSEDYYPKMMFQSPACFDIFDGNLYFTACENIKYDSNKVLIVENYESSSYNHSWHHYAFTRNGNTCNVYLDGKLIGTEYGEARNDSLYINYYNHGELIIDELRISDCVRYNGDFELEEAPYGSKYYKIQEVDKNLYSRV